ncbi:26S proteasome regulatory complex ATPase RPT4 [Russula vinacea]|nr:26S proteasome regulatory complex ATPase RPT4 [Russula vinacea]
MDTTPSRPPRSMDLQRVEALKAYRDKMQAHESMSEALKNLRFSIKDLQKDYRKTEEDIKAVQSVGQIIGEVMKQLDDERYGTRVSLDMTTLTIMRILPREVDPMVYKMSLEDPGDATFAGIGGLGDQVRELREVYHRLPLLNPELFQRVGIKPPKGVLLYGPPGTGKTLLARAVAATLETNFLKVVSSAIVDKYIGESARVVREMFGYARDHEPCVIFMDEIDAIGGRRFSEGTSADREIQRTLMELLNQMDGFDSLGRTKLIMATNRPDTLDPALMRPGRLDRKIEVPLPMSRRGLRSSRSTRGPSTSTATSTTRRLSRCVRGGGKICFSARAHIDVHLFSQLSDGFNGADLRNVVTEAGMFAIRDDREYIQQEDLTKAARKVGEAKKHETKLDVTA